MEENKKLIEDLISTIECYRGGFIGEEDFISRIDDGLQELLQHNVSNSAFYNLAEWILENKRSCFIDADIYNDDKREILRKLNYSSNMLDE